MSKCHTVKHVLLINAMLTMLFLTETSQGRTYKKRMADATPCCGCACRFCVYCAASMES